VDFHLYVFVQRNVALFGYIYNIYHQCVYYNAILHILERIISYRKLPEER